MPDEVKTPENIHTYAKTHITHFRSQLTEVYFTSLIPRYFVFDPPYAFLTKPFLMASSFTEVFLWFLWCLVTVYKIAIEFDSEEILNHLNDDQQCRSLLWTFLEWFDEISV